MNRKTSYSPPAADDERLKRMRNDLQQLRQDVIASAPGKFREMVTWWIDLMPDLNLYSWQQDLIAKVLENTEVTTPAINFYFKDRALCPLCGDSPDSEPAGFAVPTGLERHLEGYGNQRQCRVVMAARDYIRVRHFEKYPEKYPYNRYMD
jgi:hypothetical protein